MGKEAEILELLEEGRTPVEIIGKGYAKSTVYKVSGSFFGKTKKLGFINLEYSIIGLKQESGMVLLTLREYRPPPSLEEIERARFEAELEQEEDSTKTDEQLQKVDFKPPPKSEEEEITRRIIGAWKEEMPVLFEEMKSSPRRSAPIGPRTQMMFLVPPLEIWVTNQQYWQLGSPSLFQVIKINLRMN